MKFLNTLLKDNDLDPALIEDVTKVYQAVKEKVKKAGIVMDEDAEFIFSNHILALLKRIKAQEFVDDMEEEFDQVSPEAFEMAQELVKESFEKEGLDVHMTEAFLVATHLDIAMQKQKEEK